MLITMLDGSTHTVNRILGKNIKTLKSDNADMGWITESISFAPASVSGFNVCSSSSAGCRKGCLFTSGFAMIHPRTIQPARIAKTRMFKLFPKEFAEKLYRELRSAQKNATKKGLKLAVRLNTISDVMWEKELPTLFADFPDITFYDYTKHFKRMERYCKGELPSNYNLTFSWSGTNEDQCRAILASGANVAVPFHVAYHPGSGRYDDFPAKFLDYPIFDGDKTDLRFLDPKGVVVGLRVKGRAKKDQTSGFVISLDNPLIS